MLLGLCLVARWSDSMTAMAAERAIGRIEASLPSAAPPSAPLPGRPPSGWPDEAAVRIDAAIEAECRLRLLYRDGERQWSRRVVWLVEVTGGAHADLLVAWCETRSAFRHFRIDRVEHAERLGGGFGSSRRLLTARYRAEIMERAL